MNSILNRQTNTSRRGAEFSSDEAFEKASVIVKSNEDGIGYSGIPLDTAADEENAFATSREELHCFIIGDTGCGKTRRLIIPSIRLMGKTGESMVISDPKGELYRKTAAGLAQHGYDIKVVNMRNPGRGQRWNPFAQADRLYHSGNEEDYDRAMLIIEDIMEILRADNESSRDPYWVNIAIQYIKALVFMLLEHGEGSLSFGRLADLEREISSLMATEGIALAGYIRSLEPGSPVRENLYGLADLLKEEISTTVGCILSEAQSILAQYTRQRTIRKLLDASDFDMEDIGRKSTALYIVLPDDSEALYPIATLMVKQIYSTLVNIADEGGGKLPNRVSFILDEFANFTRLPAVGSMLSASRSRGIRFILVCQNVGQLEQKYGEDDAETIRSNCRVWVYMGCRNLKFLKMLQELSGVHVEKYGGDEYPLMDIDMLQRLALGEIFVWNDRCSPKLCYLPDCSEYDFGFDDVSEVDIPSYRKDEERPVIDIKEIIDITPFIEEE